ncbi:MAG: hypothetical protein ACOYVK_20845 [Bacillota bacterium]
MSCGTAQRETAEKLKLFEQEGQDLGTGTLSGVFFAGLGPCPHVLPWTM